MKLKSSLVPLFLILITVTAGLWARFEYARRDAENVLNRTPDEPIYTAYASVAAHEGFAKGTRISVEQFNKTPSIQIYPPPTRIGYLYLLALVMKTSGRMDLNVGIEMSKIISVLTLFLLVFIGLRYFDPWVTFYSCAVMSFAPMELALSRKVWQDGLMTLAGGLLLLSGLEIIRSRHKWIFVILYGVVGSYICLVKESGAVLFGIFGLFLLILLLKQRHFKTSLLLFSVMIKALAVDTVLLSNVSGSFSALKMSFEHFKASLPNNSYVLEFQTGPWYSFIRSLFILSPFTLFFCAAGILSAIISKNKEARSYMEGLAFVFILFLGVVSFPEYFKNLRFLSPVFIPYYLLAGIGLNACASTVSVKVKPIFSRVAFSLAILLVTGIAGMDALNFKKIFVQNHAKDLSGPLLEKFSLFK